jgi:hypothetical protein
MRLSAQEAGAIREEVRRLDLAAEIYLYGSRVDDAAPAAGTSTCS